MSVRSIAPKQWGFSSGLLRRPCASFRLAFRQKPAPAGSENMSCISGRHVADHSACSVGSIHQSMAGTTGLEPATSAVTGQRSNQLSYVPSVNAGLGTSHIEGASVGRNHSTGSLLPFLSCSLQAQPFSVTLPATTPATCLTLSEISKSVSPMTNTRASRTSPHRPSLRSAAML